MIQKKLGSRGEEKSVLDEMIPRSASLPAGLHKGDEPALTPVTSPGAPLGASPGAPSGTRFPLRRSQSAAAFTKTPVPFLFDIDGEQMPEVVSSSPRPRLERAASVATVNGTTLESALTSTEAKKEPPGGVGTEALLQKRGRGEKGDGLDTHSMGVKLIGLLTSCQKLIFRGATVQCPSA